VTPPSPPPPPAPTPAPAPPRTPTEEEIFAGKTLEQLNAERPLGDVYFDLDESTIRDDARGPLQKNAEWMKRWTSTRVTVEGHCD
jgi:peptidoglycan-associated lipoprotein